MAHAVKRYPVFVSKPPHISYGTGMNWLRIWLDRRKLHPADFKVMAGDRVGFEITFASERDAARFEAFRWPLTLSQRICR